MHTKTKKYTEILYFSFYEIFISKYTCIPIIDFFQETDACLENTEIIAILKTLLPIVLTLQLSLSIVTITNITFALHRIVR